MAEPLFFLRPQNPTLVLARWLTRRFLQPVSIMVFIPSVRASARVPALARSLATPASNIGATKVAMSLFEQDKFINYQRIEDNLAVVRQR